MLSVYFIIDAIIVTIFRPDILTITQRKYNIHLKFNPNIK